MATIDEFESELQEAIESEEENLPWKNLSGSGRVSIFDPEIHGAFERLMALVREDEESFAMFLEDWDYRVGKDRELTVKERAELFGKGYFEGFEGTTLKDLHGFQYSSDRVAIEAQGWELDDAVVTEDGFVAYLFSHMSYMEYDSWALIEDPASGETRYFSFSWV